MGHNTNYVNPDETLHNVASGQGLHFLLTECHSSQHLTCLSRASHTRDMYTNSVNPDETPRNAASDQGPHCLADVSSYLINLSRASNK